MSLRDRRVAALLAEMRGLHDRRARCEVASRMLLHAPYRQNPLGGGPGRPERVRTGLTTFDCVTFVESVVALTLADTVESYRERLIELRYGGRSPSWEHRCHYWSLWLLWLQARGLVSLVEPPSEGTWCRRVLDRVPGLPPATVTLRLHPWAPPEIPVDLVGFASEQEDLDVFHVGIVVGTRLRHAARSAGRVVEEPLAGFLSRERGPGLLVACLL